MASTAYKKLRAERDAATEAFSVSLRRVMAERQVSGANLADQIGVSPDTVTDWARGVRSPRVGHVVMLARVLNVEAGALARGEA